MSFSNLIFLYLFLPLTLLAYFAASGLRRKNVVLLAASLLFYAMGQPVYMALLVLLSYGNFVLGKRIIPGKRKTVWIPVLINIGVLALFKYLDFFLGILGLTSTDGGFLLSGVRGLVKGLNGLGMTLTEPVTILPMGLSFYTFQVIAYMVDVYRGKHAAERSFFHLLLYLSLFPKAAQGPITRYEQVGQQLTQRKTQPRWVFEGAVRFFIGLAKKVLLADYAGNIVADLAASQADGTFVGAWLSALMFFFQIYFDFSGYSDMAIGLGRIFGFRFCENFDLPYTSKSITEFWRRWHMSLGSFFKDYIYIPLGGNRKGKGRQIRNLLIVWALTGLWHGAAWNYVLWGLYFFLLLTVEKQLMPKLQRLPGAVRRVLTALCVLIGWVIFSHEDMASLGRALGAMVGAGGFTAAGVGLRLLNSLPLLILCAIGSSKLPRYIGRIWCGICGMQKRERRGNTAVTWQKMAYLLSVTVFVCLLLWLCTVSLVGATSAPSIYANF